MSIIADLHKLNPSAKVHLYIVDLNSIGVASEPMRFYPGVGTDFSEIVFQGDTYTSWYLEFDGLSKTGNGPSPRPRAVVGNYLNQITDLCLAYQDLVGVKVTRRTTLAQYLLADSPVFRDEFYFIEMRAEETDYTVTFDLSSPLDFLDKELPGLIAVATGCPHRYKSTVGGSGCSWPGTDPSKWFSAADDPVLLQSQDVCSHKLSGCRLRFGANNQLDYGGNPGLGRSNV